MSKSRIIKWLVKIIIAIASFSVIFLTIQPFFVTQRVFEATTMVEGYSYLEKNSLDVLFLGPSQMHYTVDAGKLTYEYGINSYDLGSSGQSMPTTLYYFEEALKTQTPKIVAVEVCLIFKKNSEVEEKTLAYCYVPMPMSLRKFDSLHNSLNVGFKKSFEYAFVPLLLYHDRWRFIEQDDVKFVLNPDHYIDLKARGYLANDHIEKQKIVYFDEAGTVKEIPKESKKALLDIAETCKKNNIKLLLFKAPAPYWKKGDSISVQQFATENDIDFIDLNDYLNEISIDEDKDFYDSHHLNSSGAEKTTDYIAEILKSCMEQCGESAD